MADGAAGAGAPEATSSSGASKTPLILVLLNTLAALAALSTFVYTRILFERPPITEDAERIRLQQTHAKPVSKAEAGTITLEKITVNIRPEPGVPAPAPGTDTQIKGKVHYATIELALEVNDIARREEFDKLRPMIMDRIIYILGRKPFHELVTVQGRYVLRSEIMDIINGLMEKPYVTNVFFNTFIVQ